MKKLFVILMLVGFCAGLAGTAMADNVATQTVTYEVQAFNELEVSGDPAALIISTPPTAGGDPATVQDATTTYAISTNCATDAKKITAAIDTVMPDGTTLQVTLVAPVGASTGGQQTLSTTAADVVTAIDAVSSSGHTITYDFSATAEAGVVASAQKTVTLTLTDT